MSRPQGKGIKVKASFREKNIHINKGTKKASQLSNQLWLLESLPLPWVHTLPLQLYSFARRLSSQWDIVLTMLKTDFRPPFTDQVLNLKEAPRLASCPAASREKACEPKSVWLQSSCSFSLFAASSPSERTSFSLPMRALRIFKNSFGSPPSFFLAPDRCSAA